jgi:ketosteroid isomerase-like protein
LGAIVTDTGLRSRSGNLYPINYQLEIRTMAQTNPEIILEWLKNGLPPDTLAEDIILMIPGECEGISGQHQGITAFQKVLGALAEKVDQKFTITDCIAEGNAVVVILEETMTPKADPSKQYLNQSAWFFRLNERQKITYLYTYDDTLVTRKALDLEHPTS